MRIYRDWPEAQNEIKRDLAELGIRVQPETMQDLWVAENPEFLTKELQNYMYQVTKPDHTEIEGVHAAWVEKEWRDRLAGDLNPGHAWKERKDVWEQFLEKPKNDYVTPSGQRPYGHFSYSYSERMGGNYLQSIITELKVHPNSRQLYLPVWDRLVDWRRRGKRRVPCSLGYWFVMRNDKVHLTYMMRSCDLFTHFANDVALASIMLKYVADETDHGVGSLTHFIGSLHVYQRDVETIF